MKVSTAVYTPAVALRANGADLSKPVDLQAQNLSLTQRPAHGGRGCFKALLGIADHVTPRILRRVECRVRAREHLIEQVRTLARGKACADSDAKIRIAEADLGDIDAQGIQGSHSHIQRGVRHENQELFAPPTSNRIPGSQRRPGNLCKLLENPIAG